MKIISYLKPTEQTSTPSFKPNSNLTIMPQVRVHVKFPRSLLHIDPTQLFIEDRRLMKLSNARIHQHACFEASFNDEKDVLAFGIPDMNPNSRRIYSNISIINSENPQKYYHQSWFCKVTAQKKSKKKQPFKRDKEKYSLFSDNIDAIAYAYEGNLVEIERSIPGDLKKLTTLRCEKKEFHKIVGNCVQNLLNGDPISTPFVLDTGKVIINSAKCLVTIWNEKECTNPIDVVKLFLLIGVVPISNMMKTHSKNELCKPKTKFCEIMEDLMRVTNSKKGSVPVRVINRGANNGVFHCPER
ncbi:unnamed protein product [Ambrosiozyma monospora]|uniref:Unnamed protein product n=1 Tax=Ambrosiozyma monospora TaxID=43982 RepID=A0ACB5SY71_AMBMO|nr:unnamed protein product [Ambrosiozyma monospora]